MANSFVIRDHERGHDMIRSDGSRSSYIAGHPDGFVTRASSFNFHDFQSGRPGFGPIRVFGDEVFHGAGCGYNMHPHHNFVICAFVFAGQLTHLNTAGEGMVDQLRAGDYYVFSAGSGGKHSELSVTPEGYMNGAHKSEVHRRINDAILAATGSTGPDATGSSVPVVIDEVPEGNWGCAGRTISLASIAESVGLSKTGERYAWVESYFAAKSRMLAASDYPADTGGVPPSMAAAPVSTSAAG